MGIFPVPTIDPEYEKETEQSYDRYQSIGSSFITRLYRKVDSQGNGLGLSGNISGYHQGGTEFPQCTGKSQHHSG